MINFTLTEAELVEDHMLFLPPAIRVLLWIWAAFALWIAIDGIRAFVSEGWCAALVPLVFFSLLVLVQFAVPVLHPQTVRRLYRDTRWLGDEQTFSWSDDGTESRVSIGHTRLRWGDFRRWTEGRNLILIFLLANIVLILPKRAFSEDQLRDLRERLNARVGPRGRSAKAARA